jgi:hypothetical protein
VNVEQLTPRPPIELLVGSATAEYVFLGIQVAIFVAAIVVAFLLGRRWKSWIPLMCMVGGALTIFLEPLIDAQLQVWWPKHQQPDILDLWGRHIPIMILPVVGWYFGIGVLLRWYWLQKYGPRTRLWTLFIIEVGAAIALEPPAINLNLWHYYGFHGLRFFGYPIWWPFVGGASAMAAGTAVYKLTPYLKGWKVILTAAIVPAGVAAGYWGIGWPMFNALNAHPAHWAVYPVSFLSIALAFFVVWMCTIATGQYDYRRRPQAAAEAAREESEVAVPEVALLQTSVSKR